MSLYEWSAGGRGCCHSIDELMFNVKRAGRKVKNASKISRINRARARRDRIEPSDEIKFQAVKESG